MLRLKLLQHLHLLLFLTRRLPHFLHPLIVHHLLNHPPRLPIQITQLAILGLNLAGIDGRSARHDVGPPFHLVDLVEVDGDFFTDGRRFERPGGFVDFDFFGEVALKGGGEYGQLRNCCLGLERVGLGGGLHR